MSGAPDSAPVSRSLDRLAEGDTAAITCEVTDADVDRFAQLSGDLNPLHTSSEFARSRGFRDRVAHGALLSALVSRFIGMELPGRDSLLLSLDMSFPAPTFPGDVLEIRGTVASVHPGQSAVALRVQITCGDELRARGKALVRVTSGA